MDPQRVVNCVDGILDMCTCCVCFQIMDTPMRCADEHAACKKCWTEWLVENKHKACMQCRQPCTIDTLQNARRASGFIDNLQIRCDNAPACEAIFLYKDRKEHADKECAYQEVTCTNAGCEAKTLRMQMEDHLKKCEFMIVTCTECNQEMTWRDLEREHECPNAIVSCEHCNEMLKRCEIAEHVDVLCHKTPHQCGIVGCDAMLLHDETPDHIKDSRDAHLSGMSHVLQTALREIEVLKGRLEDAGRAANALQIKFFFTKRGGSAYVLPLPKHPNREIVLARCKEDVKLGGLADNRTLRLNLVETPNDGYKIEFSVDIDGGEQIDYTGTHIYIHALSGGKVENITINMSRKYQASGETTLKGDQCFAESGSLSYAGLTRLDITISLVARYIKTG